jgi:hypothetical protein
MGTSWNCRLTIADLRFAQTSSSYGAGEEVQRSTSPIKPPPTKRMTDLLSRSVMLEAAIEDHRFFQSAIVNRKSAI